MEDGGGPRVVDEWYDVVHFTIVRNSMVKWDELVAHSCQAAGGDWI